MADPTDSDHVQNPIEALADAMDTMVAAELAALRIEMAALTHLLPGVPRLDPGATPVDDGEIESTFDNMPV